MGSSISRGSRGSAQNEVTSFETPKPDSVQEIVRTNSKDKVVQTRGTIADPKTKSKPSELEWSKDYGDQLQKAVDAVFGTGGSLLGLEFSFTIADPFLADCPLIGCSTGFTKLCGYESEDIVGRNCRFLVEPVPPDQIDPDARRITKDFCLAIKRGGEYHVPACDRKPWMRVDRPGDELVMMQKNARKDGSVFNNLFYMKAFELGAELGEGRPYIVALQSELADGDKAITEVSKNLEQLDLRMRKVKNDLASIFFMECSMSRDNVTPDQPLPGKLLPRPTKSLESSTTKEEVSRRSTSSTTADSHSPCIPMAPTDLFSAFPCEDVAPWQEGRFKLVQKLCDAPRNKGVVNQMQDLSNNEFVAVKQMPNTWLRASHEEFIETHPTETELPWQDIGCTRFLNSVNFKYACNLEGVFRSPENMFVATSFATEGDLFSIALSGMPAGLKREAKYASIVFQLFTGIKQLHDMQISHRDMSLENVLLTTKGETAEFEVKIIDFSMASTDRIFSNCVRGKQSYQAPEMHIVSTPYDSFLSETFSVGVLVYSLFVKDYPWLSTKPGICKNFEYVQNKGFRQFIAKRKVRGTSDRVGDILSEPLIKLVEGMLTVDPKRRLTFGEEDFASRRSVWDEPWSKQHWKDPKDSDQILQQHEYQDAKVLPGTLTVDPKMNSGDAAGGLQLNAKIPGLLTAH